MTLAVKQQAARYLQGCYQVSERRACAVVSIHRTTKRYYQCKSYSSEIVGQIIALSEAEPRWGYRKVCDRLKKLDGRCVGRERVRLVRKREGLQVRKKQSKKRHPGNTGVLNQAMYPNHVWTYDFVMDQTDDSRRLKNLTVADEFSRTALTIECARSMTAESVKQVLSFLFAIYRRPDSLRSDNGPEFIANELRNWLEEQHVQTHYIDPGSPWQNGYGESCNSIFRDDCLNRWAFGSVREARVIIKQWLEKYNDYRPHGSLNGLTPNMFLQQWRQEHENKKAA